MLNDLDMLRSLLGKEICFKLDDNFYRGLLIQISESLIKLDTVYLVDPDGEEDTDDKLMPSKSVYFLRSKISLLFEVVR